jgi:hypothetical protein
MMQRRFDVILTVLGINFLLLTGAAFQTPLRAQSADLVLCDRIAADPRAIPTNRLT